MKIPKKIDVLLKRRTRLAMQMMQVNDNLDTWLTLKGFDVNKDPLRDVTLTGAMIYVEPWTSEKIIRQEIEKR